MQVHGATHVHGAQPIGAPHHTRSAQPAANHNQAVVDQLDISHEADLVSRMQAIPEVRTDRVAALRAEIESGVYESSEKLNGALENLLDEIA